MFIFENNEGKLLLRDEFVLSCEFVKNLFEDTGETDPATPILFSNNYSLSHLKNMEQFFIELQNIHINDQPCLDFIAENKALYREKYAELIDGKNCLMSDNINSLANKIVNTIEKPNKNKFLIKEGYKILKKYSVINCYKKIDRDITEFSIKK